MEFESHAVYLNTEVPYNLAQIIEAGLTHLEVEYDENTFEVDYQGVQ